MTGHSLPEIRPSRLGSPMRASGFSLIELMVALVIGVVLIAGAVQVYVDSHAAYEVNETTARLQENARYAMSVLEPDVRMAGYWGLISVPDGIVGKALPTDAQLALGAPAASTCGVNFPLVLGLPVQGTNDGYTATCATGDGRITNSAAMPNADTLTLRRASTNTVPATSASGPLRICSTRTSGLLVTDITGTFCQDVNAQINNLIVNMYYVDQSSSQAGVPSLRRKALNGAAACTAPVSAAPCFQDDEIVSGVEDMQVQYGVDLTGGAGPTSGAASEYLDAGATLTNLLTNAAAPAQIVAVRVWLLVRSDTPEGGFTDDRIYEYGDRLQANGTTGDLTSLADTTKAYRPSLNTDNSFTSVKRYRRLLVSKTIQIRNAAGR
jgi:type IV pilus assembly protein PilW